MIEISKTLSSLKKVKILVIGDIMLDHYMFGIVDRISPEAPVPVLKYKSTESRLGGAANVALNLSTLGVNTSLCGITGDDNNAKDLFSVLEQNKINTELILKDSSRSTTKKTRIIAQKQQLLRIDEEEKTYLSKSLNDVVIEKIKNNIKSFDAVIISDYGKGMIHSDNFFEILNPIIKNNTFVALDPKKENFDTYKDVSVMTPNNNEAEQDKGMSIENENDIIQAGKKLINKHNLQELLITRGENGMVAFEKNGNYKIIPTYARSVYDVSGAGDTVIASYTASRASGADIWTSAEIANHAAGVAVSKFGTNTVSISEIAESLKR